MCTCPYSPALGYRFHRHPCPQAGEVTPLEPEGDDA